MCPGAVIHLKARRLTGDTTPARRGTWPLEEGGVPGQSSPRDPVRFSPK